MLGTLEYKMTDSPSYRLLIVPASALNVRTVRVQNEFLTFNAEAETMRSLYESESVVLGSNVPNV